MEISIIGAGITGLTTALALNKLGMPCNMYERASELKEVGAGIWMAPNAMKVFDWLGIGNEIRNNGIELQRVEITNNRLEPLRKSKNDFISDTEGNTIVSIHRAKLQSVLFNKLLPGTIHLNKEFISCKEIENTVVVKFKDSEITSSIVLGADGLHSKVRDGILPDSQIRYSGQTCWRGVSDIKLSNEFASSSIEAWGKHIRFGFSVIEKDKVYWFAVAKAPEGQQDEAANVKSNLHEMFMGFSPWVKQIIQNTPNEKITRSDICDLKRLTTWSKGRICLLGDAGHATTPNMGQGGAQGVEDAYYISTILSKTNDYEKAFQLFETKRRKKVDTIVKTSWILGKLIHHSVGQELLKLSNKLTPDSILQKQMKKLYSVISL